MKKRITIVEDNEVIREGFAAVISNTDLYEISGQYDTCEEAIRNHPLDLPDLVLMDIDLPGKSGIEGTSLLIKKYPSCIVLIITVLEDSQKVFQSLCAGAGGYIVKNTGTEDIIKSIDEAFAGGAPMSFNIAKMVVKSFSYSHDSPLSEREKQVLRGIAEGKSYSKIALDLFISKETVRTHIKNIYKKLEVNDKASALKIAGGNRWIHN